MMPFRKKYNTICDKVNANIKKKKIDSKPVYNKKLLKTKMLMSLQITMIKNVLRQVLVVLV